ncbi:uncharacterized protein LOC116192273 isoform X2 [Punica granatum]|uniref:Uncharacterized protein LOC116192273 isoform X2 n=1 Tax=Punica granatum TaxID=22663 RepID=A0A6P8C1Z4_PUNGR|nr:uncharacterized protein LOC116192273 isoform X2 [Punica granatum]
MELLYLLCSIVSTFFTSLALSLLLPLHALLRRWSSSTAASDTTESIALYEGTVWHERRRPIRHSFRYSVRYALVDLDRAPHSPPGHLSVDEARESAGTNGPVVGYEQNPLSLYYCYERSSSGQDLQKCIAEVTNTPWGERVTFVFDPNSDLVAKPLHVSPFMDMLGNWSIKANAPGNSLFVVISVRHPELGDYFTATLKIKKVPSSSVVHHAMFFWLMPHKVALWIYWHAFKLWWKNVSFIQHPRYSNTAYREEASIRDRELNCSQAVNNLQDDGNYCTYMSSKNGAGRSFAWRDAKWPWS